jgi:hypothetical protein
VKRFVSLQFLISDSRQESLGGGDQPTAGPLPTQDNTNIEQMQTKINALSGSRTHDPSVPAGEDISCLIPRGHCDRQWCVYKWSVNPINQSTARLYSSLSSDNSSNSSNSSSSVGSSNGLYFTTQVTLDPNHEIFRFSHELLTKN